MVKDWKNVSSKTQDYSVSNDSLYRMFLNKHYAQASVAFCRAGQNGKAAICDAYLLREKALSTPTTASVARTKAFITAAKAFITCAQDTTSKQANECLTYYGTAGGCYLKAHDLKNAGDSYQMAKQHTIAARIYQEGGYFDELVEVITQHKNVLDSGLLEHLTKAAQMYYFKVYF